MHSPYKECTTIRSLIHTDISDDSELNKRLKVYEADLNLPDGVEFGLQHFSYNNSGVVDVVFGHLNRTNFTGIAVTIPLELNSACS